MDGNHWVTLSSVGKVITVYDSHIHGPIGAVLEQQPQIMVLEEDEVIPQLIVNTNCAEAVAH